jgi:hypothetical protein
VKTFLLNVAGECFWLVSGQSKSAKAQGVAATKEASPASQPQLPELMTRDDEMDMTLSAAARDLREKVDT